MILLPIYCLLKKVGNLPISLMVLLRHNPAWEGKAKATLPSYAPNTLAGLILYKKSMKQIKT